MRIYPQENSVRKILKDIHLPSTKDATNMTFKNGLDPFDLENLNRRLSKIDSTAIRRARIRYELFFEEVMVSANLEHRISFTTVLMILAHYNVINDNKSLKLEEFLRRRNRLQRVEEQVRRRTVLGFFDTMYWSRNFRKHLENKRSSKMTEQGESRSQISINEKDSAKQVRVAISPVLTPLLIPQAQSNINLGDHGTESAVRHRSGGSITSSTAPSGLSPILSPSRAVSTAFALESGNLNGTDQVGSNSSSRRGSSVGGEGVLKVIDDSAWGESIRRSFTMKPPSRGHDRFSFNVG